MSAAANPDLVATTFKRLHPVSYLSRFLHSSIREDGRALADFRHTTLTLGSISTADGSSFVRLGNTSCIAAIKAEIAAPQLSRPREGYLIANVELPAACSSKFKPGAPGEQAQVLTSRLSSLLNSSNVLDREQLCIEHANAVWCLYLDVSFICFDGNAIDAAVLASIAALSNTKLARARFDSDTHQVLCSSSSVRNPLHLDAFAFAASFSIVDNTHLLSDASAFESTLSCSHVTIAIAIATHIDALESTSDESARVSFIHQCGRLSTNRALNAPHTASSHQHNLSTCIHRAHMRANQLAALLRNAQCVSG